MKFLILLTLVLQVNSLVFASPNMCKDYYQRSSKIGLNKNFSEVLTLSSNRKMKVSFYRGSQLEKKKEITVVLHGLGKSSKDLKYLRDEAIKNGDSLFVLDLHGFGETAKLNDQYAHTGNVPYHFNRDDILEILQSFDSKYKIKLVGHSYGGGIALSILEKMKQKNISLNISKVILLSTFVKSLDKYYQDAAFSGQNILVALDYMNPVLKQVGVPSHFIETMDQWNNYFVFTSSYLAQQFRDSLYAWNPFLNPLRNSASSMPNYMANMILAPYHILANSEISEIKEWQNHPFELPQLLLSNVSVINGIQDLNFLDYSKKVAIPNNINIKVVHAQNDSVVPNTITQEFQTKLIKDGFSVESLSLMDENHYYLYSEHISKLYHLLFD